MLYLRKLLPKIKLLTWEPLFQLNGILKLWVSGFLIFLSLQPSKKWESNLKSGISSFSLKNDHIWPSWTHLLTWYQSVKAGQPLCLQKVCRPKTVTGYHSTVSQPWRPRVPCQLWQHFTIGFSHCACLSHLHDHIALTDTWARHSHCLHPDTISEKWKVVLVALCCCTKIPKEIKEDKIYFGLLFERFRPW